MPNPSYPAKIRQLMAKASQSAMLCFEVDGILGEMDAQLGSEVAAFDFSTFYGNLGLTQSARPVPGRPGMFFPADPSRLIYDSAGIHGGNLRLGGTVGVHGSQLAALRAETAKAALDAAVLSRQNAYLKKYTATAEIITQMTSSYSATAGAGTKPNLLTQLSTLSQSQTDLLTTAYTSEAPPRTGVVKSTQTLVISDTTSGSKNWIQEGNITTTQTATLNANLNDWLPDGLSDPAIDAVSGAVPATLTQNLAFDAYYSPASDTIEASAPATVTSESLTFPAPTQAVSENTQVTESVGQASVNQNSWTTDYGYRVPYVEAQAQNARAQISLLDEQFSQFLFGIQLPSLDRIFANELASADLGVKQLQIAYVNTILLSPIIGTVTGIYKNVGERVKAGEPVVRIENNSVVYLVGTLVYGGPMPITTSGPGSNVAVTTSLMGAQVTVTGSVVAVRGHKSEEDEWEVVVKVNNISAGSGNPTFPLNYQFDFDDTTIAIS
jgi:biotin carboxyl carrier protein